MRYLSLLPLWTSIALPEGQDRLSNGVVEAWFNITKNHVLHGKPANSIGDFERAVRPSVVGRLKENVEALTGKDVDLDANDSVGLFMLSTCLFLYVLLLLYF